MKIDNPKVDGLDILNGAKMENLTIINSKEHDLNKLSDLLEKATSCLPYSVWHRWLFLWRKTYFYLF